MWEPRKNWHDWIRAGIRGRHAPPRSTWISSFHSGLWLRPLRPPHPLLLWASASATGSALIVSLHPPHPRSSVLNSRLPSSHLSSVFVFCTLPAAIFCPSPPSPHIHLYYTSSTALPSRHDVYLVLFNPSQSLGSIPSTRPQLAS